MYNYGFNGMEKDNEVKGNGNSYTTLHRIYDPRLGRWLSVDPETDEIPEHSPYIGMGNNPVEYNGIPTKKWTKKLSPTPHIYF